MIHSKCVRPRCNQTNSQDTEAMRETGKQWTTDYANRTKHLVTLGQGQTDRRGYKTSFFLQLNITPSLLKRRGEKRIKLKNKQTKTKTKQKN